jgi:hypothetical protein
MAEICPIRTSDAILPIVRKLLGYCRICVDAVVCTIDYSNDAVGTIEPNSHTKIESAQLARMSEDQSRFRPRDCARYERGYGVTIHLQNAATCFKELVIRII